MSSLCDPQWVAPVVLSPAAGPARGPALGEVSAPNGGFVGAHLRPNLPLAVAILARSVPRADGREACVGGGFPESQGRASWERLAEDRYGKPPSGGESERPDAEAHIRDQRRTLRRINCSCLTHYGETSAKRATIGRTEPPDSESAKPDLDDKVRSGLGGLWRLGGSTSREEC
jgi:hypothetical protein